MDLFSIAFHAWKNTRSTIILGNWKTLLSGGFKVMEIHQTNLAVFRVFICFQDSWTVTEKLAMAKSLVFFPTAAITNQSASFASSDSSGVPRLKIRGFCDISYGKIYLEMKYEVI